MATTYNFTDSLERIDAMLASEIPEKPGRAIPSMEAINASAVYMPQATVIHVNFEIMPNIWHPVDVKYNLPVIQCFVSEAISIGGNSSCCKDIMVTDKCLCLVYDTSLKTELNEALDDAARVRTLALVVSKKAKQRGMPAIKASIGMDYGAVNMLPINLHDDRFSRFMWMGETIDRASRNADTADDDIVISDIVWKNLTENNRKLFEMEGLSFSTYRGKIVNIAMNNWVSK